MPGNMIESTTPKMRGHAAMHIALDGDLLALEQPLGDQPLGADGCAGVVLEHALERLEELIEIVPVRQAARRVRPPSSTRSAPIEKNDFTGLTNRGKRKPSGSGASPATSIRAKEGTASGTCFGLLPPAPDICAGKAGPRRGRGREGRAVARRRRRAPSRDNRRM